MNYLFAEAGKRRFLLSLAAALLVHLLIGLLLTALPKETVPTERTYNTIRVTLASAARAQPAPVTERPAERRVETEPSTESDVDTGAAAPKTPAPAGTAAAVEAPEAPPADAPAPVAEAPAPETADQPAADASAPAAETPALETADQPPADASPPAAEVAESPAPAEREPAAALAGFRRRNTPTDRISGPAADTAPRLPTLEPARYVAPEYPEAARRSGWAGTVIVELTVGNRGRVSELELLESSGYEALDRAALRAARLWRFPRRDEGKQSVHHFEFRLEQQ